MEGLGLPKPAAVQQDGDQDVLEAQPLIDDGGALLAARGEAREQQVPDAIGREDLHLPTDRRRRFAPDIDRSDDLGAGLMVGTVGRIAEQSMGLAPVEAAPIGNLLGDRGLTDRVERPHAVAVF